jgi:hypothetical protein
MKTAAGSTRIGLFLLVSAIGLMLATAGTAGAQPPITGTVRLCHRAVDSWSFRTVEPRTAYRHLVNHSFWDIIEPFTYQGETYSLNWNAENQAFLERGCKWSRPVNDRPFGAIALTPGVTVTGDNRGARVVGEAITACLGEPVWHSVWYTFEGTGGPVTVDATRISGFWPNGAVYVKEDGAFIEMGQDVGEPWCIWSDGTPGLESFPTEAGVKYWIQIGGFSEALADTGTFSLTVNVGP